MKLLENKWAFVTGSSRGIGQQIAVGLAQRKCNVIVHARTQANGEQTLQLLQKYGIQTHMISGELSQEKDLQAIIQAVNSMAAIDILYNNAAIQSSWKTIWEFTEEEWLQTFRVNLFAMITLCNAFAPGMKKRGFGRIINLTSGIKDIPQLAPYSVSKAAVDKYSRDLAAELQGTNVLVN
jgi:short-subunit dehydrogenase